MQKFTKRGWSDELGLPYDRVSVYIDALLERGLAVAHLGPGASHRRSFYTSTHLESKIPVSGGVTIERSRTVVAVPGNQTPEETTADMTTQTAKTAVINFTMDAKLIGNLVAQDPLAYAELLAGVQDARAGKLAPLTSKIGSANLGNDQDQRWFGFFLSTDKDKKPMEAGLFYRNRAKEGEERGSRLQCRLREQPKNQQVVTVPTQSLGQALPEGTFSPEIIARAILIARQEQHAQGKTVAEATVAVPDLRDALPLL